LLQLVPNSAQQPLRFDQNRQKYSRFGIFTNKNEVFQVKQTQPKPPTELEILRHLPDVFVQFENAEQGIGIHLFQESVGKGRHRISVEVPLLQDSSWNQRELIGVTPCTKISPQIVAIAES
jgi:hypothetical protein